MKRVLGVLFLCACGGSSSPDASSNGLDAGVDAAIAPTFCVGTPLDNSCAQVFLAPLASCLDATGACTTQGTATSGVACWPDSAKITFSTTAANGGTNYFADGTRNGLSCFATSVTGSSASPYVISAPNTGGSLTYYPATGMIICPDNHTLNVGTDYGGCDAFRTLLAGPDFSTCVSGTCP